MKKLIENFYILVPYLLSFLILVQVKGSNTLLNVFIVGICLICFIFGKSMIKDKSGLILSTCTYVIMIWFYQYFSPEIGEAFHPYNAKFYYLYAVTGISFWLLGYNNFTIFSRFNVILIYCFSLLAMISAGIVMYRFGGVSELVIDTNEYELYYQILPYLLLWMTSIMYLYDAKLRAILIFLFAIIIILSTKRGPLVSMIIALVCVHITSGDWRIKSLFQILLFLIIPYFVINLYFEDYLEIIQNRFFVDEGADISNGRNEIWDLLLYDVYNRDILSFLIGSGYESSHLITGRYFWSAIGAHNDYIEVLYCMGFLGLLVFLYFIYCCLKIVVAAIAYKYKHANLLVYNYVLFIIGSYFSSNLTRFATCFFGVVFFYFAGEFFASGTVDNYRLSKNLKLMLKE